MHMHVCCLVYRALVSGVQCAGSLQADKKSNREEICLSRCWVLWLWSVLALALCVMLCPGALCIPGWCGFGREGFKTGSGFELNNVIVRAFGC
jgi:hypothetical protein